jgi:hypothetical protein
MLDKSVWKKLTNKRTLDAYYYMDVDVQIRRK